MCAAHRAFRFERLFAIEGKHVLFVCLAAQLFQFAVHVQDALRTGAFVQIIDILRYQEKVVAQNLFQLRENFVSRIRLVFGKRGSERAVEFLDAERIAPEAFGRSDRFDRFVFPESAVSAKRV